MFQGVSGAQVALPAPDPVALPASDEPTELMDLVASQAVTIRKLETELAEARRILFLAHQALLQRNLHQELRFREDGELLPKDQEKSCENSSKAAKAVR
jgi:hypothetical protein